MSVSYYAGGKGFDRAGWRAGVLDELRDEGAGWRPLPHTGRLTEGRDWLLLVDGSVRGVEVSGDEDGEAVRIGSMGSLRDWELGFRILRMALERGAEVRDEEGVEVTVEELGKTAAEAGFLERWAFGRGVLESLVRDGRTPSLECGLFSLVITGEDLRMGDEELAGALEVRVRKYGRAHPATAMVLRSPDGEHEMSTANYGQMATLVPDDATHLTFGAPGSEAIDGVVSVGDFKRVFGELVEPAGRCWYVPGVDFGEERVLLKALKERAVTVEEALETAPGPVAHPDEKPVTAEQRDVLDGGPALVFLAVAASDGKVNKRETTTFAKVIVEAGHLRAECPSLGRALEASLDKVPEMIARIEASDGFDVEAEMRRVGETVDVCLSEDEAQNYKLGLLYIGKEVAEASGGFFGLGRRICEGEATALKMIAGALGIGFEEE